jgi:hypothetical protein
MGELRGAESPPSTAAPADSQTQESWSFPLALQGAAFVLTDGNRSLFRRSIAQRNIRFQSMAQSPPARRALDKPPPHR